MINFPSEVEIGVYTSDAGYVVITHCDFDGGEDVKLVMSKGRALDLAKALKKVALEAE